MESYLIEVTAGLQSPQLSRRKKSAEELNKYLKMESVQLLITNNTLEKDGHYCWNDMFDGIHNYILKETTKCESKTFEKTAAQASTILNLCVANANKGKAYIACDRLTQSCLEILNDLRLKNAIGDAYLNLLYKHLLSQEYYLRLISVSTWKDLLDVCLTACISRYSKLDDFAKLRLVSLVIKNATHYTQFIVPLRDAIPKCEECFVKISQKSDQLRKAQEIIVEIIILLLETLSAECRLSVCQFMESILPCLFHSKMYDQTMDQKKKSLVFQLLYYDVRLHHPLGRTKEQEGSLAHNWDVWIKQMNNIMEIICMEITGLKKIIKPTEELLTQCQHFYQLSAAVYYQIFAMSESSEGEIESESKRQKCSSNKNKTFGDLIDELRQNLLPWLGIVHAYVKDYSSTISIDDYISLMNVIVNFRPNNAFAAGVIEELTCTVLKQLASHISCRRDECESVILSVWNQHVRNSTTTNSNYGTRHKIMQCILTLDVLDYSNTVSLFKYYTEKSMPLTSDSATTFRMLLHKFFNRYSHDDVRSKCVLWLTQGDITNIDVSCVKEVIISLICNENVEPITFIHPKTKTRDELYDAIFNSNEKCYLFSGFELAINNTHVYRQKLKEKYEINPEIEKQMSDYFQEKIMNFAFSDISDSKSIPTLLEYMQSINIVVVYLDIVLQNLTDEPPELFRTTQKALVEMYVCIERVLKSQDQMSSKIKILQIMKEILLMEHGIIMGTELRSRIPEELLESIKRNLMLKVNADDEDIVHGNDDIIALKHSSLLVLTAFCTKLTDRTEGVLKKVLYRKDNLDIDAPCLFQCIDLLMETNRPPIKFIFVLMQNMVKDLYRDPLSSMKLLKTLHLMLDEIWSPDFNSDGTKQNCIIMLKVYVSQCGKQLFPPNVVALIYKCIAKTTMLIRKYNTEFEDSLKTALRKKLTGDIHSLRVYCCYLLKIYIKDCPQDDVDFLLSELNEIFEINVAEGQQQFLKDELSNRTLTVLHCYLAIGQTKTALVHQLITRILKLQKEKSLDKVLVQKMLHKFGSVMGITNFLNYTDKNIVSLLYFWFTNKYSIEELPIHLLGHVSLENFKDLYRNWLIAADIIWIRNGIVNDCDLLKQTKESQSIEKNIEDCFTNIVALCLPYVASEKYDLRYKGIESPEQFRRSLVGAQKLFRNTGDILKKEIWSNLLVENIGKLVFMAASNLWDCREAKKMFNIDIPEQTKPYGYPWTIFSAILKFFGDLTSRDIMQYLCKNEPMAIFKVLFSLWENVLDENVLEFKVTALHAFIAFFQTIPIGLPSDAFVSCFVCSSFAHSIEDSQTPEELRVYAKGARIVLEKLMQNKNCCNFRQSVSQMLPILVIQKEAHEDECRSLFEYLTVDMKDFLNSSQDVDFMAVLSQPDNHGADYSCSAKVSFSEKVRAQISNLTFASTETLTNLYRLLQANKHYVNALYQDINSKGFSKVCESSVIHQLVCALSYILNTNTDEKVIIMACNCLSEIGSYDLKTLVTVPPVNTQRVVLFEPKNYMARIALKALYEVLFDGNPVLTETVAGTLNNLFKSREGINAFEVGRKELVLGVTGSEDVTTEEDRQILKPLKNVDNLKPKDIKMNINNTKFDQYCVENCEGIFIKALTFNWDSDDRENHSKWLQRVAGVLLRLLDASHNYLDDLLNVSSLKSNVCRKILPGLLGLIVQCSTDRQIETISRQINKVFEYIWEHTFDDNVASSGDTSQINQQAKVLDAGQKMVIQYMLKIVDFVRLQSQYYKRRSGTVETLNYLRLDYDKVSWAATVADQNLVAIYYGELWAVAQNDGIPPSSPEATTSLPGGENIQQIFRKCYVSIGEWDAIEGCGTAHLTMESEKRRHLMNTGQFIDALLLHDIALSSEIAPSTSLLRGAAVSLHYSGMHHLALQYIKSLPDNEQLNDIKYECMVSLGDWSEIVVSRDLEEKSMLPNCNQLSILKAFHYACLKDCLNVQTTEYKNKLILPINRAKLAVSRLCQKLNMENCQSVYQVVSKLHLFADIEDYISVRTNVMSPRQLISKWEVEKLPPYNDFKHLESLISQRVLILEHAAKSYHDMQDEILSLQIQYAKLGLSNNRVQMSQRLLAVVKKLRTSEEVTLLESEIAWAKGHKDIALSLLRNVVTNDSNDVNLTARSLRQYALWMAETKRDNTRDIIDKYLIQSLNVLKSSGHQTEVETSLKIYHDIAKFADGEYKQVVTYMKSSVYENKVQCLENMKDTASSLRMTQNLNSDGRKVLHTHERFRILDEDEIRNTQLEKDRFLNLAMRYYLLSLKQCDENNLSVFRVISLWLDNPTFEFEKSDKCTLFSLLNEIPSRKFITVLPQLAPRLTTEDNKFAKILRHIIKKCAIEHPHHTLPILFALKNSEKDKGLLSLEPRNIAAEALVKELAAYNDELKRIIEQMELICDAIISFANYQPNAKDNLLIPKSEPIDKLRGLDAIPVPTVTIPIRNDCKYTKFPRIHEFKHNFELVGGINCPKKVVCTDSTGNQRILLIKGKDDMRQDAVMQQVFSIVNTLLEKNPVTNRNKLLIRTYKVVPMSKQSGVLEWCVGTIPLGGYLAGSRTRTGFTPGAHSRYRPQDIPCQTAREMLVDCYNKRKSKDEKLKVFLKILRNFKPVFHYFFTEHYLDPVTWYERRLAYTKSVATSSMVGYIMGLGDRHVQNILIDTETAEVIHIDFGIAFDLGKTLPTPETVPFRLTQDIISGFGSSGVEGIFRGCCEKTMQLLRDNSETLLTILEVLLCDPLYNWTVSTGQQNVNNADITHGASGSSPDSGLAQRALLAVGSKLSGTEGGVAGGVAVPGQVARLLRQAVDPNNLCRLFHGWQPYL